MVNFKEETLEAIKECGKTILDIDWIGRVRKEWNRSEVNFMITNFWEICDIDYYNRLDRCCELTKSNNLQIPLNYIIVFKDGSWLDRREYDGAEWWEYQKCPIKPEISKESKDLWFQPTPIF